MIQLAASRPTPAVATEAAGPAILRFAEVSPEAELRAESPGREWFAPPAWMWAMGHREDPRVERALATLEGRGVPARAVYGVFLVNPGVTGADVALPLGDARAPARDEIIRVAGYFHADGRGGPSDGIADELVSYLLQGTSLLELSATPVRLADLATLRAEAEGPGVVLPLDDLAASLCAEWEALRLPYRCGHSDQDDATARERGCPPSTARPPGAIR